MPGKIYHYVLLILTLLLVTYPRFNRQDIGSISEYTGRIDDKPSLGDAERYIKYVEWMRGNENVDLTDIDVPYLYRPLVPFLASLLIILPPMTAINIINVLCLSFSVFLFFRWLSALGFSFNASIAGCFLFIVSFPVFYYGAIGYIDPALFPFLLLGMILIYSDNFMHFFALLFIGTFLKETIILLLPVMAAYLYANRKPLVRNIFLATAAFLIPTFLLRIYFLDVGHGLWAPNMPSFLENFRIRVLLSWILTFGIPGIGTLAYFVKYRKTKNILSVSSLLPIYAGIIAVILLSLFSLISVYTDGRFLWPSVIFTIPLALIAYFERNVFAHVD